MQSAPRKIALVTGANKASASKSLARIARGAWANFGKL
jgi:hypothetical protein